MNRLDKENVRRYPKGEQMISISTSEAIRNLYEATQQALGIYPLHSRKEAELFGKGAMYGYDVVHDSDLEPKVSGRELAAFKLGEAIGTSVGFCSLTRATDALLRTSKAAGIDPKYFGKLLPLLFSPEALELCKRDLLETWREDIAYRMGREEASKKLLEDLRSGVIAEINGVDIPVQSKSYLCQSLEQLGFVKYISGNSEPKPE